ncbi:dTDP-4-dehydrorhamnose reductase [Cellulomonas bogoriensis 69B4 = DSM 16987]|uniref:dTDP-4-dehydrorhamnose reductase n=2 Tax=Cellulomonas bogoriensis TaxID=301388 RepID=A0A0A0BMM6_9CELL|nr:dTDP-4-dehydrorhamnose reductase [Cellulomonas bogoriensis 69B4 = DSM 16987]
MRWLVTGASGMLGSEVVRVLTAASEDVTAVDRAGLDITRPGDVRAAVAGHDVVVNCAAYTAVDPAEADEATAFAVNAVGAAAVARAAHEAGARLVHVSTDYVMGEVASAPPLPWHEDASPDPRTAYGRSKLAGEWAVRAECPDHLVVRTAWLYGRDGTCFPRTIAVLAAERGALEVVDDQWGQPTWALDLARLVHRLVARGAPAGTYHGTAAGETSWFEFARAVVGAAGMDPALVRAVPTSARPRGAARPSWSVLGHESLAAAGVEAIGPWEQRWVAAAGEVLADLATVGRPAGQDSSRSVSR